MNHPALEIDYDPSDELKLRYELLCRQKPSLRAHDAARELNVSEAELVASRADDTSFHLLDRPEAILKALEKVGEILLVTRNEAAVLEKRGHLRNLSFNTQNGLLTGQNSGTGIDLRLLLNNWRYGFLVIDEANVGRSQSLQFFDASGQVVQKVYLTQNSNEIAFAKLVSQFISPNQPTFLDIVSEKPRNPSMPEQSVQWHKVRESWQEMQSSYDFFQLLIGSQVTRQQAYDNVGRDLAYEIVPSALEDLCQLASKTGLTLTFAVSNKGSMQFHCAAVGKIREHGGWLNILGEDVNLHINSRCLAQGWVVRKPNQGNPVTSVEFFDHDDQLVLQISAEQCVATPESTQWQNLVAQLQPRSLNVTALKVYDAGLPA
ncbi:MAG: ChuX/HutX family heme-like substrate-binding protein [Pseudomonadales bacterium]